LAYAAGEDDPTPLVADIFPAHKRIGYDKKNSVKIMDDNNRDIAIFIITHMLNTCRAIIIQGDDGKNILPSVFRSMGLVGVILLEKMIQHLIPDYKMTRAEYSMEDNFPMYLTFNKKTGKICFILTCPQIGSTLVRLDIGLERKLWTRFIHLLVSIFLKITGTKYHRECFPDFTTVKESVFSILNTKTGASDHMELLHKSGQLLNEVIFKAPCQNGGEKSNATDPGKPEGSHFIEAKNRYSIPSADRGKARDRFHLRIEPERQPKQAMRLTLGNQRAAISSRRRIVIQFCLRIEPEREANLPSASLRVDPLNGMLRKRRTRSTKRLYQRKGLGLQIPKKSCSSAGLRERRALI
jgi:hypothetical protein